MSITGRQSDLSRFALLLLLILLLFAAAGVLVKFIFWSYSVR